MTAPSLRAKLFCLLGLHYYHPWAQSHYEQVSAHNARDLKYRELETRYCRCCGKFEWRVKEPQR